MLTICDALLHTVLSIGCRLFSAAFSSGAGVLPSMLTGYTLTGWKETLYAY